MIKTSQRSSGVGSWCKQCKRARSRKWYANNGAVALAQQSEYYQRNREARLVKMAERRERLGPDGIRIENRRAHWRKKYGITEERYYELLAAQNGVCAICGQPERDVDSRLGVKRLLAVDHCHSTGAVRGLLCRRCNTGIGLLDHDVARFMAAARYLQRGESNG